MADLLQPLTPAATPVQRPLQTGISKEHFSGADWHEKDLAAIFRPRWHYAGHMSELPDAGSFLTYALGPDEIVVTRRKDGTLAAYYNFCRHRGFPLVTEERGHVKRSFSCGYHGWTFSQETGACLSATKMDESFDKSQWGLRTSWVEDWHGMIFVSFAEERPRSVAESMSHVTDADGGLHGYDLDRMKVAATIHREVEANWKVVVENDEECYHCTLNHPQLVESYDPWSGFTVVDDLDAPHQHIWVDRDWPLVELGESKYGVNAVCRKPMPRTSGDEGDDVMSIQFFWRPSGHLALGPDHGWMWSIRPLGPERTLLTQHWFVAADAVEGEDYEIDKLTWLMEVTMEQDEVLCARLQRGFEMRNFTPGPLNPHHQTPAIEFYEWYERCHAQATESKS